MNSWERGALYSVDSAGKRIRQPAAVVKREEGWIAVHLIKCRGTQTYVSVTPDGDDDRDERQRQYQRALERLTPGEYDVLRMQSKIVEYSEIEKEIPAKDLPFHLQDGWTLIGGSAQLHEGGAPETVRVTSLEPIVVKLSLEQIAEEKGISVDAVRKRIERGQRKLRGFSAKRDNF